ILETNIPLHHKASEMLDIVHDQELYGKRYAILKSPEIQNLFWNKSEGFKDVIVQANMLPEVEAFNLVEITRLHGEHDKGYVALFKHIADYGVGKLSRTQRANRDELNKGIELISSELSRELQKLSLSTLRAQSAKAIEVSRAGASAFSIVVVISLAGIVFGLGAAMLITKDIFNSIAILRRSTRMVAEGNFEDIPVINSKDELGELSEAFRDMAMRIKEIDEIHLDSNPLTHLPGGATIEVRLKEKLDNNRPFSFCMIDLDHFKAVNDHYGYLKGNDAIKLTARILSEAVRSKGVKEDFVGHIGGDDFVIITGPKRHAILCNEIIRNFDNAVPELYSPEDRKKGYIMGKTRQGEDARFPLLTISIAVVTNQKHSFSSYLEVSEVAAELKEYAKSFSKSSYVVDKRHHDDDGVVEEFDSRDLQ
ncbi:MAG: diguanylate cyclase, partial [Deltaproteobacteria bacterium]|nr:diguanylate cyclase [Deltaproteobacteria bacterium]